MIELFRFRNLIFWWGLLTASYFLQEWLKQFAKFFRDETVFNSARLPFSLVPSLNDFLNNISQQIADGVQFKPDQVVVAVGTNQLLGWQLAAGFAVTLILIAVIIYVRSLRSPLWWDDFVALFVVYSTLRIVGHIVAIAKLPIENQFRAFVDNPVAAFVFMLVLTLLLVLFGVGFRNKTAFWRALIEMTTVALLMFPLQTAQAISAALEGLAYFGNQLSIQNNAVFAIGWGAAGALLAMERLLGTEGGEGGGASPLAGLLGKLRRKPKAKPRPAEESE